MTRQQAFWRWSQLETILDQLETILADCEEDSVLEALGGDWHACADRAARLARRVWPDNPDQWERRQTPQILQRG